MLVAKDSRTLYAAIARKKNIKSPPRFKAPIGWLYKYKCKSGTKHAVYQSETSSASQ